MSRFLAWIGRLFQPDTPKPTPKPPVPIKELIQRRNRFVPIDEALILDEPLFALTGTELEAYKRTQKAKKKVASTGPTGTKELPSKDPRELEAKQVELHAKRLKAGRELAISRAKGVPRHASGADAGKDAKPLNLRTVKCLIGEEGKRFLEDRKTTTPGDLPQSFYVKFADLREAVVPYKSLLAPKNRLIALLRQRYPKARIGEVTSPPTVALPPSAPAAADPDKLVLDAVLQEKSASSGSGNGGNGGASTGNGSTSRSAALADVLPLLAAARAPLEELTAPFGGTRLPARTIDPWPPQSPTDAVAYHDFYDLKIAWTPIWTAAIGAERLEGTEQDFGDMPKEVAEFLPFMTEGRWDKYRAFMDSNGGDWRDIRVAAAQHKLALAFLATLSPGAPLQRNQMETMVRSLARSVARNPDDVWQEFEGANGIQASAWGSLQSRAEYQANVKNIRNLYKKNDESWIAHVPAGPWTKAVHLYRSQRDDLVAQWSSVMAEVINTPVEDKVLFGTYTAKRGLSFPIFAPGTVNYGLLVNYRQQWKPLSWQVGELAKTIPLAPKESRKYKTVTKESKKRSRKEIEKSVNSQKSDDSTTTRAEDEVVGRAREQSDFSITAGGGISFEVGEIGGNASASSTFHTEAAKDSSDSKKKFRESVAKSARELSSERSLEVVAEESFATETEFMSEISNPNEEITVTYLFYELQRQYETTEWLHKADAVLLVAEDLPHADTIGWDWIRDHDWILRRVLLDDSFASAIDFVLEGKHAIQSAVDVARSRKETVQGIFNAAQQKLEKLAANDSATEMEMRAHSSAMYSLSHTDEPFFVDVFEGLFGGDEGQQVAALEGRVKAAQERLDRITQKMSAARDEVAMQRNALDRAIDTFNKAVADQEHKLRRVSRFIQHLRQNLLYYMQAIWSYEPVEQRYLRLFDREIPFFDYPPDETEVLVRVRAAADDLDKLPDSTPFEVVLPEPPDAERRRLDDVADLNTLLGFRGNYLIFPLRRQSYLTAYMAQEYLGTNIDDVRNVAPDPNEPAWALSTYAEGNAFRAPGTGQLFDPDRQYYDFEYAEANEAVLHSELSPEVKMELSELLRRGAQNPASHPQKIVLPLNCLYVEALPGAKSLLEPFKLQHRAIDVQKAKAERYAMILENARLEARLHSLDFEDPQIDKLVKLEGTASQVIVDTSDTSALSRTKEMTNA